MVDKEKKVDRIVIGVLIIIILLLLGLNACTLKKNGEDHPGEGKITNSTVLDLKCEKSCKKKENNNGDNGNSNGNGSNRGTGNNTGTNTGENNTNEDETVYDMLEVYDDEFDTIKWNGSTKLNIFENSIAANGKIAPESHGTYEFDVRNSTDYKLKYDLSFAETNSDNINMKYKLKKNGTYVISDYVSYNELALSAQMLEVNTKDVYELEWKWFSSDNDTNIGTNGASYSLQINLSAEGIE